MPSKLFLLLAPLSLLLFFHYKQSHRHHPRLHPRLSVRKLYPGRHQPVSFDPLIADFERKLEDQAWESEHFHKYYEEWKQKDNATSSSQSTHLSNDAQHHQPAAYPESQPDPSLWDYVDPEDYVNNQKLFNISRVVMICFLIDISPPDNLISFNELDSWLLRAGLKANRHQTDRKMKFYDRNNDGIVSFPEYFQEQTANDTMEHSESELFNAADDNGDGFLNNTEFNSFLHPQDSNNKKLHRLLRKHEIKVHDHDHDGQLNFTEFFLHLFDIIMNNMDGGDNHSRTREALAKQKFDELDENKDGFLTEDELTPLKDILHPGESIYAKLRAEYLMDQADVNRDGHLTLEEMLENSYVFYTTVYVPDDDTYLHEEFR